MTRALCAWAIEGRKNLGPHTRLIRGIYDVMQRNATQCITILKQNITQHNTKQNNCSDTDFSKKDAEFTWERYFNSKQVPPIFLHPPLTFQRRKSWMLLKSSFQNFNSFDSTVIFMVDLHGIVKVKGVGTLALNKNITCTVSRTSSL